VVRQHQEFGVTGERQGASAKSQSSLPVFDEEDCAFSDTKKTSGFVPMAHYPPQPANPFYLKSMVARCSAS